MLLSLCLLAYSVIPFMILFRKGVVHIADVPTLSMNSIFAFSWNKIDVNGKAGSLSEILTIKNMF